MNTDRWLSRTRLLAISLLVLTTVAAVVLGEVIHTVVFAVTVAYTLLPSRRRLRERGYSRRLSTGLVTGAAGLAVIAMVAPLIYVLYRRREALLDLFRELPPELVLDLGVFTFAVETAVVVRSIQSFLQDIALSTAAVAAVTSLKALLFAMVVYGLLYRPSAIREAAYGLVPADTHDVLRNYHHRVSETLIGIYLVQAVTALGTGVVAYVVFVVLGYDAALTLAVISGLLQFIPVLGPSLVVVALAGVDVIQGNSDRAVLVLLIGLLVIGFLPDAVIRPRLAGMAGKLPATLYFVGFVGGVLTLGPIGFVVGPLVVALLVETVTLLSEGMAGDRAEVVAGGPEWDEPAVESADPDEPPVESADPDESPSGPETEG